MVVCASGAVELGLTVSRDIMYETWQRDTIVPAVALLGTGFRLGDVGRLWIRAGYFGETDRAVQYETPDDERNTLHGVRLQVTPMLWYKTPLKAVSLYAGVGLAGRGSLMSHSYHQSSYVYTDMSEVWTIAANQTFLVGLGLELSRRFGLNLEAERAGFLASYAVEREYKLYEGWKEPIQQSRVDEMGIGWLASAPTGLGVGLRLKL